MINRKFQYRFFVEIDDLTARAKEGGQGSQRSPDHAPFWADARGFEA